MDKNEPLCALLVLASDELHQLYKRLKSKPPIPPKPFHLRSPTSLGFENAERGNDSRETLDSLDLDLEIQEIGGPNAVTLDNASEISSTLESVFCESEGLSSEKESIEKRSPIYQYESAGDAQLIQSALMEQQKVSENEPIIMNDLGLHSIINHETPFGTQESKENPLETQERRQIERAQPPQIPISPLVSSYSNLLKILPLTSMIEDPLKWNYSKEILNELTPLTRVLHHIHLSSTLLKFLYVQPQCIAYQLCLIEQDLFLKILPQDFLLHRPPKSPTLSVLASTHFFNYLTRVIEFSILEPSNAQDRSLILSNWIKIAKKLYDLRNFQTLKAVLSAVSTPPIIRLKQTWSFIQKKRLNELKTLSSFLSETNNYALYRKWMKQNYHRPMIPYLGIYLHDLTYILALETRKNTSSKSLNKMIQDIFNQIRYFQSEKYARIKLETSSGYKLQAFRTRKSAILVNAPTELLELNSVDEQAQSHFIQHWILTQKWHTEKDMDLLSLEREGNGQTEHVEISDGNKKPKSILDSIRSSTIKVISRSNSNPHKRPNKVPEKNPIGPQPNPDSSQIGTCATNVIEPF